MTGERMAFPQTFDEFAKDFGFRDSEEIYTNGVDLIPVFRVKQWLKHIEQISYENKQKQYQCFECTYCRDNIVCTCNKIDRDIINKHDNACRCFKENADADSN